LLVMGRLLDEIKNLVCEISFSQRKCFWVDLNSLRINAFLLTGIINLPFFRNLRKKFERIIFEDFCSDSSTWNLLERSAQLWKINMMNVLISGTVKSSWRAIIAHPVKRSLRSIERAFW
jgi:hypothetical protein